MSNFIQLTGNLGKDAESKVLDSGATVTKLSLCTDDGYFNRDSNEWVSKPNWHTIILWRKLGERSAHYKKGHRVTVTGKLEYRSYEDGENKRYITEIIAKTVEQCVTQDRSSSSSFPPETSRPVHAAQKTTVKAEDPFASKENIADDDLPF